MNGIAIEAAPWARHCGNGLRGFPCGTGRPPAAARWCVGGGSDPAAGAWSAVSNEQENGSDGATTIAAYGNAAISPTNQDAWVTLASEYLSGAITLDMISSGVLESALENIAYLRAQNGGGQSRLSFNLLSLSQQKTNMSAALGRIVDTDIAEESSNIAKYTMLTQVSASILAQANSSNNIALMLIQ